MEQDIRWKQRFQNFEKAILLLNEISDLEISKLSQLEKEGIVQRFEFTLELAWKTLKDKMESDGIVLETISPKSVIKEAFQSRYIDEAGIWLNMINDRNLLSHTYDFEVFLQTIPDIQQKYIPVFLKLYQFLKEK